MGYRFAFRRAAEGEGHQMIAAEADLILARAELYALRCDLHRARKAHRPTRQLRERVEECLHRVMRMENEQNDRP